MPELRVMRVSRWHIVATAAIVAAVVAVAVHDAPSRECVEWSRQHKHVLFVEAVDGYRIAEPPRPKGCI